MNHRELAFPGNFGIQVKSAEQLADMTMQLQKEGLRPEFEHQVNCCYAVQDKMWAKDPDGNAWEVFLVTQDDAVTATGSGKSGVADCCAPNCCGLPADSARLQSSSSTRKTLSSTCWIETQK